VANYTIACFRKMTPTKKARGRGTVLPVVRGLGVATRRTATKRGRRAAQADSTVSGQRLAGADTGMPVSTTSPGAATEPALTGSMINTAGKIMEQT
jgi:hypothetical protein